MSFSDLLLPLIAAFVGALSLFTDLNTSAGRRAAVVLVLLLLAACGFQIQRNMEDQEKGKWQKVQIENLSIALKNFESNTGSSLGEIIDLVKSFGSTEEDPTFSQVKESLQADSLRTQLAKANAPETRKHVTVQYFPKDVDGEVVEKALRELGFTVTTGNPGIPDVATNAIFFGDSVPLNDVKLVATTLIRAGVRIRHIRPFQNSNGRETLIQVGSGTAHVGKEPLSVEVIKQADRFPIQNNEN